MKLFEQCAIANGYWVRYFDTDLQQSRIQKIKNAQSEYYVPNSQGKFSALYSNDKYEKRTAHSSKIPPSAVSVTRPDLIILRDEFKQFNQNPHVWYLDIETHVGTVYKGFPDPAKALEPVSLLQIEDNKVNKIFIIADKPFYYQEWYLRQPLHDGKDVVFIQKETEHEMFEAYFKLIAHLKPCIQYAWNGDGFDFLYLFNRAKRLGFDLNRFSPFADHFTETVELTTLKTELVMNKTVGELKTVGTFFIDMKKVYQKVVVAPRPSYSLDAIAEIEIGANKVKHDEFKTFEDFYHGNWVKPQNPQPYHMQTLCWKLNEEGKDYSEIQKAGYGQFVYYGILDVRLLRKLDEKVGLTKLTCKMMEMLSSQYDQVTRTTGPWGNFFKLKFHELGIVNQEADLFKRNPAFDVEKHVVGGFVREPVQGMQRWVLSADVNSMYPLLGMVGSNMSPETLVFLNEIEHIPAIAKLKERLKWGDLQEQQNEQNLLKLAMSKEPEDLKLVEEVKKTLKELDLVMSPCGVFFKKSEKALIPETVEGIYNERKSVKKQKFKYEQKVIQIQEILNKRKQTKS